MNAPNHQLILPGFDGATFESEQDGIRLSGQMKRVFDFMSDGGWHTLREIAAATNSLETAVSARLRDCRKSRFGGHRIELRRIPGRPGVFEYRLLANGDSRARQTGKSRQPRHIGEILREMNVFGNEG